MATHPLAIHVLPDSNPSNVWGLVTLLSKSPSLVFDSSKELVDFLTESGVNANAWVQSTSASMGLLTKGEEGICLSMDGFALSEVRDDARGDLLHFLVYTGWSKDRPKEFLQSWAYRLVCDRYWERGTVELTSDMKKHQVGEVINLAQIEFMQMDVGDFDEISFSGKSLRGIYNWLEAVSPPVITNDTFSRRTFCPPELVIMAIGWVLREENNTVGIDILLTPEKREAICKICLLEPDALDRVLDWALPIFGHIITPGTQAGFYGRFIRLHKIPQFKDLVR